MTRQSVELTDINNDWLVSQVASGEYRSKNEALNDILSRARRKEAVIENIRHELMEAENSGFTNQSVKDIRAETRKELNLDD